jgi:hypothetical protein
MQHFVTITLLLAGILTQGLTASSQSPAFGVYFTAGNIKYIPGRAGETRPILLHDWLYQGDRITLVDNNAEITLIERDTSYVQLRGKGTYTIDEIRKMQHTRVHDTLITQYLSLLWAQVSQPAPTNRAAGTQTHSPANAGTPARTTPVPPARPSPNPGAVLAPRPGYATTMDSLVFRWRSVYWARKYFLRLRDPDGRLCFNSVIVDTETVVHFPGQMTAGNTYTWTLDIVGESRRLQFADSNHIVLVNDSAVLPRLPPITPDSIGGFAALLQRIEQYENAGCIKEARDLFEQLTADFSQDPALDQLYFAFRQRNYF